MLAGRARGYLDHQLVKSVANIRGKSGFGRLEQIDYEAGDLACNMPNTQHLTSPK